jgi:hypothetical protein
VLVARALAGLTPDLAPGGAPTTLPRAQSARLALGRAVVRQVALVTRRMPAELLAVALPPPSHFVALGIIEHRTRNVVERLVPFESSWARQPWSVARYLRVPGFGPRCLTDLLAAHEEAGRASSAPDVADARPSAAALVEIARRLRAELPLTGPELRALFPSEGFARAPEPLRALLRAFVAAGVAAPFRLVRRAESTIAVAPGSAGVARVACEEASRQVAAWGLSEVDEVAARVERLSESAAGGTIVRRVLVALPRLRWLDERMGWFSFVGERSPLAKAVERAFAQADALPASTLVTTLLGGSASARRAPIPVLMRYLSEIAGCEIVDGQVRRRAVLDLPARPWRETG